MNENMPDPAIVMKTTLQCSEIWTMQTQHDRIRGKDTSSPGIDLEDEMLQSKSKRGKALDSFLEKRTGSSSIAQKALGWRKERAWKILEQKLIVEAKNGRALYQKRKLAEMRAKEGKAEQEKADASADGGQSLLSDAVRSGRMFPTAYSSHEKN